MLDRPQNRPTRRRQAVPKPRAAAGETAHGLHASRSGFHAARPRGQSHGPRQVRRGLSRRRHAVLPPADEHDAARARQDRRDRGARDGRRRRRADGRRRAADARRPASRFSRTSRCSSATASSPSPRAARSSRRKPSTASRSSTSRCRTSSIRSRACSRRAPTRAPTATSSRSRDVKSIKWTAGDFAAAGDALPMGAAGRRVVVRRRRRRVRGREVRARRIVRHGGVVASLPRAAQLHGVLAGRQGLRLRLDAEPDGRHAEPRAPRGRRARQPRLHRGVLRRRLRLEDQPVSRRWACRSTWRRRPACPC